MNGPLSSRPPPLLQDEDERELAGYVPTGDVVDQQAAAWLLRRQAGLSVAEAAQLKAWLAADPAHRHAFERHEAAWAELDALPAESRAALRAGLPDRTALHGRPEPSTADRRRPWWRASPGPGRRWIPQAALAVLVVAAVTGGWLGFDHWQRQPTFTQSFATTRGQLLNVNLPDGSRLQLDTSTRAEVALYRTRREVRLPEGQAMFTVQANVEQPFDVYAGPLRITVVGTRFSVRNTPDDGQGRVQVAVEEGRVRVAPAADTGTGVLLTAGQSVAADATGGLGPVASVPPAGIAPWRDGRVSFDDTPLARALAEFERYGDTRLRIRDPAVAALRLSGSFDVRKADNFARALTQALPVRLRQKDDETEIVMAR